MKSVNFLLFVLILSIFLIGGVLADDLTDCRDKCKANFDNEEDRSPCIIECKELYGNPDMEYVNDGDEDFIADWDGTCGDVDCSEVQIKDPGLTPDSAFYFIDEFFDNFGDEIANREERVAEIKAMIEKGNYEAAHKALEKYKENAKKLEEESDPDKRDEARRSAAAIKNALDEVKEDIPEDKRDDFYNEIIEEEKEILTAVEISSKIKDLCVQLAELDPLQYAKTCKSEDDAPEWKKKLHEDLTEEQRKEAKEFGNIMAQCFKTSGKECRCEDISFQDFSIACSKIAPLASKCDAGSEDACRMMDEVEMPRLPDHLEDILDEIEGKYGESKYDMYMPPECVEAGATSPKECGKIMIKEHAPLECRKALLDSGCERESECREICDKIMFKEHAPQECIDEGITSPKECAEFMDNYRRPEGEYKHFAPLGKDCMGIEDNMKRLECFEGVAQDIGSHYGVGEKFEEIRGEITWQCKENRIHWPPDCERFMKEEWPEQQRMKEKMQRQEWEQKDDWRIKEKECAVSCDLENGWWDFRDEDGDGIKECVCYATEGTGSKPGEYGSENYVERDYDEGPICDDCESKCGTKSGQRLKGTSCGPSGCECYWESTEQDYYEEPTNSETTESTSTIEATTEIAEQIITEITKEITESTQEVLKEESVSELTPEPTSDSEPSLDERDNTAPVTGNAFLEYYY